MQIRSNEGPIQYEDKIRTKRNTSRPKIGKYFLLEQLLYNECRCIRKIFKVK